MTTVQLAPSQPEARPQVTVCQADEYQELADIFIEMNCWHYPGVVINKEEMTGYLQHRVLAPRSGTAVYKVTLQRNVVAFACVSVMYPAPRFSGQMFIKELFVSAAYRRQGIGKLLMQFIARQACEQECYRLDWLSSATDKKVQAFYQAAGGQVIEGMNYHRLFGDDLSVLAQGR
ncbi:MULTISPECIES: GNAT family N-acetyltransferase [unclassified Tatumella]|uniref:GNAT family N-acetyltransferase n=1 Tax=unclassified Tatumella TaxID=2649542 RepID=UPI001BAEE229|nr:MULTISPECIES: GNAT family N-acetyltransferase [unclassified Tatumella]MBS0855762.1 GNAT family N-acetyltransferase [Tatumella sp. JGM16]MBS0912670.1 GNAT family N-acetyltransferase [Tatumella sp. JGM91]